MSIYSKERALSGAVHYLGGRAAGGIASFLTILLMVRYMGTADYAAYTALTGVVMLGTNVSSLGLERAIARYVPDGVVNNKPGQLASFIRMVTLYRAGAAVLFALATALLWQPLTGLFDVPQSANVSPAMIAMAVIGGGVFQVQSAVFQSLMRQQLLTRVLIAQWGSRLVLTLFFVSTGANISLAQAIMILAVPEVLGAAIAHLAIGAVVRSHVAVSAAGERDQAPWPERKGVIEVSGYNYLFNLLAIPPQGAIMRLVIAALCPPQFVAAYGFFQSLVEKARQYLPTQLLYMLIEPLLIAKYMEHGNLEALRQRTRFLYVMNLLILMPAMALVIGVGGPLTSLLTGDRYTEYWWLLIPTLIQLVLSSQIVLQKIVLTALDTTLRLIPAALLGLVFYGIALFMAITNNALTVLPFTPLAYFMVVIAYLSLYLRKLNCDVAIGPIMWLKILLLGAFVAGAAYVAHVFTANVLAITSAAAVAAVAIFAVGSFTLGIVTRQDLALLHNRRNNRLQTNERTAG
ncbi:MAG TPA: oligosaccharide flippase family protein [Rhodocyclaceae bacterium]|nr:oligosaccharide flippase family protein [Rhodocyclaceae bacterium]